MTYPVVVLCVMAVIFLALLIFVVPTFQKLFTSLHATLPAPTLVILKMSKIVLSPFAPVIWSSSSSWRSSCSASGSRPRSGRHKWDAFKLKPPVFGALMHKVSLARFTHTLGSLVQSGVPILESLDIVSETAGNKIVGDVILEAKAGVREGRSLADMLAGHEDIIPPLVTQMIEVGEQTGALDTMLHKVGEFYDGEVENTVSNLTSLLEPMLTVVLGFRRRRDGRLHVPAHVRLHQAHPPELTG